MSLGVRLGQQPSEQVGQDIESGCGSWRLPHLRSVTLWVWGCWSPRCPSKPGTAHTSPHILGTQLRSWFLTRLYRMFWGHQMITIWKAANYPLPPTPLPPAAAGVVPNSSTFLKIHTLDVHFSPFLRMAHTHPSPTEGKETQIKNATLECLWVIRKQQTGLRALKRIKRVSLHPSAFFIPSSLTKYVPDIHSLACNTCCMKLV